MYLVVGATGFVGHYLLLELVTHQHPIRATYRTSIPAQWSAHPLIQWFCIDLYKEEEDNVFAALLEGVSVVYHLASMVSFHKQDRVRLYQTNVLGTKKLLHYCVERVATARPKFIYVSTIASLSHLSSKGFIDEQAVSYPHFPSQLSFYAYTKYLAELEVWRASQEGLKISIAYPSVIVGYDPLNKSSMSYINAFVQKKRVYYTDGSTAFVDVKDVAKGLYWMSVKEEAVGQGYILSAENLTFEAFTDLFLQHPLSSRLRKRVLIPLFLYQSLLYFLPLIEYLLKHRLRYPYDLVKNAFQKKYYDNRKFLALCPFFVYTPLAQTIDVLYKQTQHTTEKY